VAQGAGPEFKSQYCKKKKKKAIWEAKIREMEFRASLAKSSQDPNKTEKAGHGGSHWSSYLQWKVNIEEDHGPG
jgi:hypothetical protein